MKCVTRKETPTEIADNVPIEKKCIPDINFLEESLLKVARLEHFMHT